MSSIAVLQLKGPQVNPEIGLLPMWTFASSHCIYAGFLWVLQFPSASKNMLIGGLDIHLIALCVNECEFVHAWCPIVYWRHTQCVLLPQFMAVREALQPYLVLSDYWRSINEEINGWFIFWKVLNDHKTINKANTGNSHRLQC